MTMTTAKFVQAIPVNYTERTASASIFKKFMQWCEGQQTNRLLWIGVILAAHGCILTPLTVMVVFLGGTANIALVVTAIAAMGLALVTNLAALPTKITIPAFALSIIVDIAIIAITIAQNV